MKNKLFKFSIIFILTLLITYNININVIPEKQNVDVTLSDLAKEIMISETVASTLGSSNGQCGAVNYNLCYVIQFGEGGDSWYWYGYGKP